MTDNIVTLHLDLDALEGLFTFYRQCLNLQPLMTDEVKIRTIAGRYERLQLHRDNACAMLKLLSCGIKTEDTRAGSEELAAVIEEFRGWEASELEKLEAYRASK